PIQNLPYATFRTGGGEDHVGVAIGEQIFDLTAALEIPSLVSVMAMVKAERVALRRRISALLSEDPGNARYFVPIADAEVLLPCEVGDYTDFYASIHHATNVGSMFRPDNPLLPNYKYVPIGYHGRASSILVSGTPILRPHGQSKDANAPEPSFGPSKLLDYELEAGLFIGPGNSLGDPIPIDEAESHIFGLCLVNDWSARDIQAW